MASRSRGFFALKRFIYYAITLMLAGGVLKAYLFWLDSYRAMRPEVVAAQAMGYVEELPLEGILLWDEEIVRAGGDGVLTYPSPLPRRVMKGEAMAAVDGTAVRASSAGYFVPALDGEEGVWVYNKLWNSQTGFPPAGEPRTLDNGARLRGGDPIGKLAPQPQELRCIAYLDKTESLMRDISNLVVEIKTEPNGKIQRADVKTHVDMGQKVKLYLALPFFPPSALLSRTFSCRVITGASEGVSVPDTAVILRGGKMGVLRVIGNTTEFTEVAGFPIEGGSFFITAGLKAGTDSVVVRYADRLTEGAVRLW